jgi:exo-beta-1,3-glucanase (GH17 family)
VNALRDRLQGVGLAYSGYREGQSPDNASRPSLDEVAEDLRLLARNWKTIRVYSSAGHGEDVLRVIRRDGLDLEVMLGVWLAREPGAEAANAREIAEGIRLANEYEDIVAAINVGNEVLIEWTAHPVPEERVVGYVREVKAGVPQPVTVADNYVWWREHGSALAREVDFITMHTYPLWERKDIDEALAYTVSNYEDVRDAHPGKPIVIGEAGWATYTEGNLHVPRGGDEWKQARYYEELTAWTLQNGIPLFFFEAFDEPWKGTGTEGHWGLFTVDRRAKPAVQRLYPDRMPDGPTSPGYPDQIRPEGPDLASAFRSGVAGALVQGSVNPLGPGLSAFGEVPSPGSEGGTALRLVFNGESWGGVYFLLGTVDARGAGAVGMRLKLPPGVASLEMKLEGPETNARSVNVVEHAAGPEQNGWRTFSVPLAAFEGVDPARLAILGFWNPTDPKGSHVAGEVLFDDFHFE